MQATLTANSRTRADRTAAGTRAARIWGTLLVLGVLIAFSGPAAARQTPESFADLAETLLPSVVNIATTQVVGGGETPEEFEELFREFFERRGDAPPMPRQHRQNSLGSGFIIGEDGYIVTNNHVIEGADEIAVRLHDDRVLDAVVVGIDDKTDLALLKVETTEKLPAAKWGNSDSVRIGDWVLAIGNPFGLGGTVTAGIISARQRNINAGPYDDFLQTDAAINRGNSGGPMFNMAGEVIGVNTAIFSPSGGSIGIGFAIPAVMARNVVDSLRRFGEVQRGWLGVRIQTVTEELAEGLRLPAAKGALVASVVNDGPAASGGIQQGDVILRFDGREVPEMQPLPRMVAETPVDKEVEVVVWRKGREVKLRIVLGKLEEAAMVSAPADGGVPDDALAGTVDALGLKLALASDELRQQFGLDAGTEGVVITEVVPDGSGAEKGLQPGDVIVEIDQDEVKTPAEVAERVAQARRDGYRVVTLLVLRGADYQWVAVRIDQG